MIAIAPMMDWTDRHDRYFLRLIAPHVHLYTEMITAQALHYGDRASLLDYDAAEHPLILQLGGSDPLLLAESAKWGEEWGYQEINLNVGCPSPRVSKGRFGACLMREPQLVAECIASMRQAVGIPLTVKCRLGIDNDDSDEQLHYFIETVSSAGCNTFIIHARKAWLQGLSPKENRDIPPLQYERVYALKQKYPHLAIMINGGINNINDIAKHLQHVDGVMIGREAYHNPYFLAAIEATFFQYTAPSRELIIQQYFPYIAKQLERGVKLSHMTRHILGLFHGQMGGAKWRRHLSEQAWKPGAGLRVIEEAVAFVK